MAEHVGEKLQKKFGSHGTFEGTVTAYDLDPDTGRELWHVQYADGDSEDLERAELIPILLNDKLKKLAEPRAVTPPRGPRPRAKLAEPRASVTPPRGPRPRAKLAEPRAVTPPRGPRPRAKQAESKPPQTEPVLQKELVLEQEPVLKREPVVSKAPAKKRQLKASAVDTASVAEEEGSGGAGQKRAKVEASSGGSASASAGPPEALVEQPGPAGFALVGQLLFWCELRRRPRDEIAAVLGDHIGQPLTLQPWDDSYNPMMVRIVNGAGPKQVGSIWKYGGDQFLHRFLCASGRELKIIGIIPKDFMLLDDPKRTTWSLVGIQLYFYIAHDLPEGKHPAFRQMSQLLKYLQGGSQPNPPKYEWPILLKEYDDVVAACIPRLERLVKSQKSKKPRGRWWE